MKNRLFLLALLLCPLWAAAEETPIEIHDQIVLGAEKPKQIALTLDACSGKFDHDLIEFLIRRRIPATIFATRKWIRKNAFGVSVIKANLDLFDVEDHGANHIPAVIGKGRQVYGISGEPDIVHLRREISEGARAINEAIGIMPHWYRAATAEYDPSAIEEISRLGYKIAGFSVNADEGATLKKATIEKRLRNVKPGDIIIAHMNRPESDTAEGLAVALTRLQEQGFVFVRLDQVEVKVLPQKQRH